MCVLNMPREAVIAESHPHELWQKRAFGVYHTSNGRRLPVHEAGLLTPAMQDQRMADYDRWNVHKSFEPNKNIIQGAQSYAHLMHLPDPHAQTYHHITTDKHNIVQVGRAYDALPEFDRHAVGSFEALHHEVNSQYHHLTNTMGVNVQPVDYDPYKNVHEMHQDLQNNKRLKVMKTAVTGEHPFFSNDDNDKFRAVHDAFGHAATGRSFDANGEEAAWTAHSKMFSHHALPALTSETRGQNASLHLNGDFGPQRIALLPKHLWMPGGQQERVAAADWNDYRWMQDAQNRRYEQAGVGGGKAEHDEFYGNGEYRGAGTEHRITPREWITMSRQPKQDELPAHQQEWHRGWDMGYGHARDADNADLDAVDHTNSQHPEHFFDGYSEGFRSGVDTARSAKLAAERDQGELAEKFPQWESQPYAPGRLQPVEDKQPSTPQASPRPRYPGNPGRWPYNETRAADVANFDPFDTERQGEQHAPLHTMSLLAVRSDGQIKVLAHDSGSTEVIYHCPFCGSGQVIARSDGTVMCEFCNAAFTVQVQPEFSAFPQTIDGQPVDIPGMGGQSDNPDVPMDDQGNPADPDQAEVDPTDPTSGEEQGQEEDGDNTEDEPVDSGGNPLFNKKSTLRTQAGVELSELDYIRHLALRVTPNRERVLNRIRLERAAGD